MTLRFALVGAAFFCLPNALCLAQNEPLLEATALETGHVLISWPAAAPDFILESTPDIEKLDSWMPWPSAPALANNRLQTLVLPGEWRRFFRLHSFPPPPAPAQAAPPLPQTEATTLLRSTSFLFEGSNAVQIGVAPGTIQPERVAVLRGRVTTRDGQGLSGVNVKTPKHPEFGLTVTQRNGEFDLVVNGGERHCIRFEKPGFCPVDRELPVSYQSFDQVPVVVLMQMDLAATQVAFGPDSPQQVHEGTPQTDSDGTRTACLIFSAGTCAEKVMPDGTRLPCSELTIRATEFTVGTNGPAAMPAQLPPTSAYTYCVELSADEAVAAGASSVVFDRPVSFYVDNFLNLPVGTVVPVGYYDRSAGVWKPLPDGRVIKILSVADGKANLDTDGDGTADSAPILAAQDITEEERARLATLHPAGKELWRSQTTHFSPVDHNNASVLQPDDETRKGLDDISQRPEEDDAECRGFGALEPQNQIFREFVPLAGVSCMLHYSSERTPAYTPSRTMRIPVTTTTPPPDLVSAGLAIGIAGQVRLFEFGPEPSQTKEFVWDGKDAYGRQMQGSAEPDVLLSSTFGPAPYTQAPQDGFPSFGRVSGLPLLGSVGRGLPTLALNIFPPPVTYLDARSLYGLGGWSLGVQHFYDPVGKTLHLGDGRRRRAENLAHSIKTAYDLGTTNLLNPYRLAFASDGSLYVLDFGGTTVERISPDGQRTRLFQSSSLFNPFPEVLADGVITSTNGAAGTAGFQGEDIAVGPDGLVYLANALFNSIIRFDPDNRMRIVAGANRTSASSGAGFSGDGGPAKLAKLDRPISLSFGLDGALYFIDGGNSRVRRIGPEGNITTFAGNGEPSTVSNPARDEVPATRTPLKFLAGAGHGMAFGPDGSLYFACYRDNAFGAGGGRIMRVTPDGVLHLFAGGLDSGDFADGQSSTNFPFVQGTAPKALQVARDGTVYCLDNILRVRTISKEGVVRTLTGQLRSGTSGDDGPAARAGFGLAEDIALSANDVPFVIDRSVSRIRSIAPAFPGVATGDFVIASEDGAALYHFSQEGRHLETRNALTGAVLLRFDYNSAGHVIALHDSFGNTVIVERDGSSRPLAIVGPFGHRTALTLDNQGWLASVKNPLNETIEFTHSPDGLLTKILDPRGEPTEVTYNAKGALTAATKACCGPVSLARTNFTGGYTAIMTTARGVRTEFNVARQPDGARLHTTREADGTVTRRTEKSDGSSKLQTPANEELTLEETGDPRFGMQVPIVAAFTVKLPSGLTSVSSQAVTADMSNPLDPSTLRTLTSRATVNGRTSTNTYTVATRATTNYTAGGRVASVQSDPFGRPVVLQPPGPLAPSSFGYDSRGRLDFVSTGSAGEIRASRYFYGEDGLISSCVDALNRTNRFVHDAAGRLVRQIAPDGREGSFAYDLAGNLTGFTPAGRPAHTFAYDGRNLLTSYSPPALPGTGPTKYLYNEDRQPIRVERPDGHTIDTLYDTAGRVTMISNTVPELGVVRTLSLVYHPANGLLTRLTNNEGAGLEFTYDGSLVTKVKATGPVVGEISRTFDSDLRVKTMTIAGGAPITYEYDADSLVTKAGDLTITRDPATGFATGTQIGQVREGMSYNEFGELTEQTASFGTDPLYRVQYERDKFGQITRQTETIAGERTVTEYEYDLNGRLVRVTETPDSGTPKVRTYEYDSNHNIVKFIRDGLVTAATYDAQDRIVTMGAMTFEHTPNGERKRQSENGQSKEFEYDDFGALRHVVITP